MEPVPDQLVALVTEVGKAAKGVFPHFDKGTLWDETLELSSLWHVHENDGADNLLIPAWFFAATESTLTGMVALRQGVQALKAQLGAGPVLDQATAWLTKMFENSFTLVIASEWHRFLPLSWDENIMKDNTHPVAHIDKVVGEIPQDFGIEDQIFKATFVCCRDCGDPVRSIFEGQSKDLDLGWFTFKPENRDYTLILPLHRKGDCSRVKFTAGK